LYKKLTIFLVLLNVVTGVLLFQKDQENKAMKQELLRQYIQSQQSITQLLDLALESYDEGDVDSSFSHLKHAHIEYQVANEVLANLSLGKHLDPPYTLSNFAREGMILLSITLDRFYQREVQEKDINDIQMLAEDMKRYTEKIHYDQLVTGEHQKKIFEELEGFYDKSNIRSFQLMEGE